MAQAKSEEELLAQGALERLWNKSKRNQRARENTRRVSFHPSNDQRKNRNLSSSTAINTFQSKNSFFPQFSIPRYHQTRRLVRLQQRAPWMTIKLGAAIENCEQESNGKRWLRIAILFERVLDGRCVHRSCSCELQFLLWSAFYGKGWREKQETLPVFEHFLPLHLYVTDAAALFHQKNLYKNLTNNESK